MGGMLDSQRSKFWSTLLLLIFGLRLRLTGFTSTGAGQGALGARTVFIVVILVVERVVVARTP